MRVAALILVLAMTAVSAAAPIQLALVKDARTTCYGYDPGKLAVVEVKPDDWQVRREDGWILAKLANKEDAAAVLAVAKENTSACIIGKGERHFQYLMR